ncbi:MAG: glycosyltransferase family 2 protein [bacterium]|nr:glycosyltransferase family 2 protein [bacterium]
MKVSVVILNWNGKGYLKDCLSSVFMQNFKDFEVIVVDNKSTDGSVEFVKKNFKKAKLVVNKKNYGFAEGNNIGVRKAKGKYIALLNNDTVVDKNWLSALVKELEKDKKNVIVGSRINNVTSFYHNSETLGSIFSLMGEPIDIKARDKTFSFSASGCSMIFRKDVIREPFDPDYFAYCEDSQLSWLVNLLGYKVKIAPDSKLDHLGGVTLQRLPQVSFHAEKNKYLNIMTLYEGKTLIKIIPLIIENIIITNMISLFKGRLHRNLAAYFWLLRNITKIPKKRVKIQMQRKLPDKIILNYFSYKVPYRFGGFEKIFNVFNYIYCRILFMPLYEFTIKRSIEK